MAASEDRAPPSPSSTFEPLRPAPPGMRAFIFTAGPLLWVASLIAVAFVLDNQAAVEIALAIVAASFLVATLLLLFMRARRLREEERAREAAR